MTKTKKKSFHPINPSGNILKAWDKISIQSMQEVIFERPGTKYPGRLEERQYDKKVLSSKSNAINPRGNISKARDKYPGLRL
jgi:hypothetical protein